MCAVLRNVTCSRLLQGWLEPVPEHWLEQLTEQLQTPAAHSGGRPRHNARSVTSRATFLNVHYHVVMAFTWQMCTGAVHVVVNKMFCMSTVQSTAQVRNWFKIVMKALLRLICLSYFSFMSEILTVLTEIGTHFCLKILILLKICHVCLIVSISCG